MSLQLNKLKEYLEVGNNTTEGPSPRQGLEACDLFSGWLMTWEANLDKLFLLPLPVWSIYAVSSLGQKIYYNVTAPWLAQHSLSLWLREEKKQETTVTVFLHWRYSQNLYWLQQGQKQIPSNCPEKKKIKRRHCMFYRILLTNAVKSWTHA